jgi:hypothetical protein
MDADFSIELGPDDPVLDFPWTDPSGKLSYFDLKRQPELIARLEESQKFPELAEFLRLINSPRSPFETAKCDAWPTNELSTEEEIFDASHKFSSYVDIVCTSSERRRSFDFHEEFARRLSSLLRRAPEMPASAEVCVRRCFSAENAEASEGFYFTLYVSGFGQGEPAANKNWAIGLKLVENAVLQLSATG